MADPASDRAAVRTLPDFGRMPDGRVAKCYELDNGNGLRATVTDLGCTILSLSTPDQIGRVENILLSPATVEQILSANSPFFGSLVGRVGNRIASGQFTVDGTPHQLTLNDKGRHSLHGGANGYDKRLWTAEVMDGASIKFSLIDDSSADGYSGVVTVTIIYTLTPSNAWRIEYEATTDAPTPINLTQHAYFNLKDAGRTDVLDHVLRIAAHDYTPADASLITIGQIAPVAGTPLDFTTAKPIGQDIRKIDSTPRGYDHNFVIAAAPGPMREIAEVTEPVTGRKMIVRTTEPGVQFYSGNFLNGTLTGPGGVAYGQYGGFCLETQHFPNSPNIPSFPNTILRPGKKYWSMTEYEFSA